MEKHKKINIKMRHKEAQIDHKIYHKKQQKQNKKNNKKWHKGAQLSGARRGDTTGSWDLQNPEFGGTKL